ncbi:hypothetical protein DV706_14055 [Natronorubrum bangense]|uniref:Uncharacterized protein n=3 Tax=Natronorubrum bangense TaxID=61858 RepID=L9WNE8_9EURY|nr:hypothetical protein C494_07680 [Natronorubrum bangense JCM 10635]QCC55492.1 hypothetical protein DV706_14055 [Natronorubrum bangense]
MYLEITAPATCTEYENSAAVTIHGEVTKEVNVEMPNANLDYYFISNEWMEYYTRVKIQGREWELDLSEADVTLEITVDEVRESAKLRASEDFTTEDAVLGGWSSLRHAPMAVKNAANELLYGEPTPSESDR